MSLYRNESTDCDANKILGMYTQRLPNLVTIHRMGCKRPNVDAIVNISVLTPLANANSKGLVDFQFCEANNPIRKPCADPFQ